MSNSSDYCNAEKLNSQIFSDPINVSSSGNSEYGSALKSTKIITARAHPCDPDGNF